MYFVISHIVICLLAVNLLFSCENTNLLILTEAGIDGVTALTLSDDDVHRIAVQAARESDRKNKVAPRGSLYAERLRGLVADHRVHAGIPFNFKVYLTNEVNAFAMADGTVRIYSGLMDIMNDEELLFMLGHEIGHVVKKHSRKKVVLAYASSAIRKGLASQENEIGLIARSAIGAFTQKLANAQFSQHEERQADDYGLSFLLQLNYSEKPAVSALMKLDSLARQHTFLSSHPDPANRAKRLQDQDKEAEKDDNISILSRIYNFAIRILSWVITLFTSWFH